MTCSKCTHKTHIMLSVESEGLDTKTYWHGHKLEGNLLHGVVQSGCSLQILRLFLGWDGAISGWALFPGQRIIQKVCIPVQDVYYILGHTCSNDLSNNWLFFLHYLQIVMQTCGHIFSICLPSFSSPLSKCKVVLKNLSPSFSFFLPPKVFFCVSKFDLTRLGSCVYDNKINTAKDRLILTQT